MNRHKYRINFKICTPTLQDLYICYSYQKREKESSFTWDFLIQSKTNLLFHRCDNIVTLCFNFYVCPLILHQSSFCTMITKPGHTIICRALTTTIQQAEMQVKGLDGTVTMMSEINSSALRFSLTVTVPSEWFQLLILQPRSVAQSCWMEPVKGRRHGKEKNVFKYYGILWSKQDWYTTGGIKMFKEYPA